VYQVGPYWYYHVPYHIPGTKSTCSGTLKLYKMMYKKCLILFICTNHGLWICRDKTTHISLSPSSRQMFVTGVSQGIGQGGQNISVKNLGNTPKICYLDPKILQCQHGSLNTFGREISVTIDPNPDVFVFCKARTRYQGTCI